MRVSPEKWRERLILVGALVWIGFFYHVLLVFGAAIADGIAWLVTGRCDWSATRWAIGFDR